MNEDTRPTWRLGDEPWSYLGYEFDKYITNAKLKSWREAGSGKNSRLEAASEFMDLTHYVLQRPLLMNNPAFDPVSDFVHSKAKGAPSPDINFSMTKYLQLHPEKGEERADQVYLDWLNRGRSEGEIADPAPGVEKMATVLGLSPHEVVRHLTEMRTDLHHRLRTGTLGEMFARAVEIEPLIGEAWVEITRPKLPPFGTSAAVDMVCALHACQDAAEFRRARVIMVINRPRWGGGLRMEGHIAHALANHIDPDDVVIVYTDQEGERAPDRYPPGVREIDLSGAVKANGLKSDQAQLVLVELLRSFRADAIVNVNSLLLYRALATYGRALASSERLFLLLFCNEQTPRGTWVGYPIQQVNRTFDLVEGVITDSHYLRDWLIERHQLGPDESERLHVFSEPADPTLPLATLPLSTSARRPQVFWAGRWDRQKRVDIVLEVAARMPDVDIRMWGGAVFGKGGLENLPPNVHLQGLYGHLSELPLLEADVWLYTSAWDGMPSQLIEVAMTQIPLVGSAVAGTTEVLRPEDSWPVEDDDPESYVKALREVLADQGEARRRAAALRERMLRERDQESFAKKALLLLNEGARR